MKKLLFSAAVLAAFSASAQTVLFSDNFDGHADFATTGVGNWILADLDLSDTWGIDGSTFTGSGTAMSFIVFNPTATTPAIAGANWAANSGSKYMASFAAMTPPNNDLMISPEVQLGASGNVISFWAKSVTAQYGLERFKVGISNGGTNPSDFTWLTPNPYVEAPVEWTFYFFQAPANFNNQNVRIGINCVSNDAFVFMVDDFFVRSGVVLGNDELTAQSIIAYPNPANDVLNVAIEGEEIASLTVLSLDGKVVSAVEGSSAQVANLTSGIYFYEVKTVSGSVIRNTFVKK